MALTKLGEQAAAVFQQQFKRPPRWLAAAPGRVNLIGEHTDYNDGFVLPMAIDRYTVMAGGLNPDVSVLARVFSTNIGEVEQIGLDRIVPSSTARWSNYVRGVLAGFVDRGAPPPAFDAAVVSNIPLGSGLSSSAALEVVTATLVEAMTETEIESVDKALLCQRAEHQFAGVPCGIMDQMASILGREDHLLLLDCRSRQTRLVPFRDGDVTVIIIDSGVKHDLAAGQYAKRRAECESASEALGVKSLRDVSLEQLNKSHRRLDATLFRRAHHVVSENARTIDASYAIARSDWQAVRRLMFESHASLRDDYQVSCAELDFLVDRASDHGVGDVCGARMTGGGFGGCTINLVRTEAVADFSERITREYGRRFGKEATAFATRPAHGAVLLEI